MLHRRASLITALLAATAVLAVGGCSGSEGSGGSGDPGAKSAAHGGPSVIAPGKPGEANRTMSAEDAAEQRKDDNSPNAADRSYAHMMITHHTQALEMTELAPKRAQSTQVKRIAERISAAQGPEISAMKGWLATNGKGSEDHHHGTMPGMATAAQLTKLRAAKGRAFDQLFLKLMIAHHDGAITMATDVKAQGNNIQIEEMADDVIAQQTSEIVRMRDML
ncbi:DUF305 domain-containing protein [Streptomyces sp. NPDC085596]|uniref:DUF305 domain-containing protein n=1 Tax=Streptomyces sp. NPDC085596 TaxID=3365731 RepID=UPI0037D3A9CE